MKEIPFIWKGAQMKCLVDGCDGVAKSRGLCTICYGAASASIRIGRTTWKELVDMRLANKPQHRGRGYGAFAKALRNQQELNRQHRANCAS